MTSNVDSRSAMRLALAFRRLIAHESDGWRWLAYPSACAAEANRLYVVDIFRPERRGDKRSATGQTLVRAVEAAADKLDGMARATHPDAPLLLAGQGRSAGQMARDAVECVRWAIVLGAMLGAALACWWAVSR